MSDRDYLYGHVCQHGSLARSCEVCDLEAEVRRLQEGIRTKAEAWDREDPDALAFRVTADFRTLIVDEDG